MGVGKRGAASVGLVGAILLFPVAAHAKTTTVFMGVPTQKVQKQLGAIAAKADPRAFMDINDFFPHGVTIHVGDRIKFVDNNTFHSVDLPRKGKRPLSLISPTGTLVSGVNDEAGNPFWFNGKLPNVAFTPALLKSGFGKHFTYRGTKRILSGLPLGPAKPFTVKFAKAGTYTYYCNVHAGMTGVVRVVRKGRKIARAKAAPRLLKAQVKRDLKQARGLVAKTSVPANTLDVGASAGRSHVEYYGMLPGNLTVKAGTSLTFRMGPKVTDVHTASFGTDDPGAQPPNPAGYLTTLAKTFEGAGPFDPRAVWGSDPPTVTATATLSPTTHGNGFWNTGVMDTVKGGPLPPSGEVTFSTPGTYQYYCLIHTNMHGTITVTP
jgi:plastocyanin